MTAQQFVRAFGAVALRIETRSLPLYVGAAIRMRAELAAKIVNAAIAVAVRKTDPTNGSLCATIDHIVRAAIAANPGAAVEIAKSASEATPAFQSCIVTAALEAAPDQKVAILEALSSSEMLIAMAHHAGDEGGSFFGGIGSINPSNLSDTRDNVNSPEQAPPGP